jgi:serine/threonine protein kinase
MHRDLKPQNILVTENWELKICDLGFSKKDELSVMNTTRIGTPSYRDPNVILHKNYTKKCDIYSTGLVFYFIFRGHGYFEYCKDEHQLFREQGKFDNKKTEVIGELNCSKHMQKIIIGCL